MGHRIAIRIRLTTVVMTLLPAALPAAAEDASTDPLLAFTGFIGARAAPAYQGASDAAVAPSLKFSLVSLNWGQLQYGDPELSDDPLYFSGGFVPRLRFRYEPARKSSDHPELSGLADVDDALEIGFGGTYVWPSAEISAELRYGAIGHESWIGEVRAHYVMRPAPRVSVRIGPQLLIASDGYMDTYFGVTPGEASASPFTAFDPSGGPFRGGIDLILTYRVGARTWVELGAGHTVFLGDAADSPIVRSGSDSYSEIRIGLRRAFEVRF